MQDRGMISKNTIETLEVRGSGILYILGCRMMKQTELWEDVLGCRG